MTTTEVALALEKLMPGRVNELPTPLRSGTRVAIPFDDETAYGTCLGSYGTGSDAEALVTLDTTKDVVSVPWSMLRRP